MKTRPFPILLAAALTLGLSGPATAAPNHDHGHKIAGPNGGRVITSVEPHLEFFLAKDRKVRITAVDDGGKAVEFGEATVRLTGGSRANPTRLSFTREGNSLVSDKAMPEGNRLPVVLQIKPTPDAGTVIEKFILNLDECPTCEQLEYACTCEHDEDGHEGGGHGDHEGHDH